MGVANIHFRSCFSFLAGCRTPEEICRFAAEHGLRTVGMTDVNGFYGLIRFLKAAEREGVKPVSGVVVRHRGREAFTAYVMDRRGYSRLCGLITRLLAATPEADYDPVEDLLRGGREGISILSDDPSVLLRLREGGTAGLYARLTHGRPFAELARFARENCLPTAAIPDTVFLGDGDEDVYEVLRAIGRIRKVDDLPPGDRAAPHLRFTPGEAVERFFSAVPEALAAAEDIAERSSTAGIMSPSFIFPSFGGLTEEEAFRMLRSLCVQGADRRYGGMRDDVQARLDYELSIIRQKGFSAYFLVVWDIVSRWPRTCGRGSAAASIVSYLLGITHVDPIRYNLFFERFLNRGRKDPPDIDVDFPWDERGKTLRYVFDKYAGRSAMVADHVTFGPRSALREPAKAFGVPEEEIGRLVKLSRLGRAEEIPPYLRSAAERIRGLPRNLGTHPGGVVITPGPITDYAHVQTSPLGWPVLAWEKDATEDAGLVKIDLLGNRSLGVLRDTLALVEKGREAAPEAASGATSLRAVAGAAPEAASGATPGTRLDWESFDPLEDPDTRELIRRGKTLGVFYVESPATRQLLTKMGRGDYENLVIASSIIRPAANRYIRSFVKRLRGAPYRPLHPRIEKTLEETYGIMVYQEDVSRVAIDIAGFPIEEADRLRKILSKKDRELKLPDFKTRFLAGGAALGVAADVLEKVWDMILSFDGYSFCKPHSASYAQVSYRIAYLKRFHPLEFYASVINNGGGFYGRQTYVNACRREGFPVLPPDVNRSDYGYTAEGGRLRVGLCQLKDLARPVVDRILSERERGGPYAGFRDFLLRVDPRLSELRPLVRSGSLDSVSDGCTRPELFYRWQNASREDGLGFLPPMPPQVGDYPARVKLQDEARTLGIIVSRHPLSLFRTRIARMAERHGLAPLIGSRDIGAHVGRRVWIPGLLVTGKEVATRKREPMIFVSFEDEDDVFETTLFPDAFSRLFPVLDSGWVFLIHGKVDEDLGALNISVERLLKVSRDLSGGAVERPPVFAWGEGESPWGDEGPSVAMPAATPPRGASVAASGTASVAST